MELGKLSPNWAGCRVRGEMLILDNDEEYTIHELRDFRRALNTWRRIALANDRALKISGKEDAVVFEMEELVMIRDVLMLLDNRLPGYGVQQRVMDSFTKRRRRA